ncbi:MAG: hypothetical protein KA387_05830 [Rubrivivax sp.]|nr:hypothetical protein [Rubrivivax sp.]
MRARFATAAGTLVLAGCAFMAPQTPTATTPRCAATPVLLLEPTPLFSGPQAGAALDRALPRGQAVLLCMEQGQRQQVLLPRPGQRCAGSASSCAGGWIARGTRTGPAQ